MRPGLVRTATVRLRCSPIVELPVFRQQNHQFSGFQRSIEILLRLAKQARRDFLMRIVGGRLVFFVFDDTTLKPNTVLPKPAPKYASLFRKNAKSITTVLSPISLLTAGLFTSLSIGEDKKTAIAKVTKSTAAGRRRAGIFVISVFIKAINSFDLRSAAFNSVRLN